MAIAGFYTEQVSRIRFGCDGRWYADDEPIANDRIALLFARHLRRRPDGTYELEIAHERAPVEVEDTAFVVTGVSVRSGEPLRLRLNDGSDEALVSGSLEVGAGGVLYGRVSEKPDRVRFLRAAYHSLAAHIRETAPGVFGLDLGDRFEPIRSTPASD